jgi:hypothetical protein
VGRRCAGSTRLPPPLKRDEGHRAPANGTALHTALERDFSDSNRLPCHRVLGALIFSLGVAASRPCATLSEGAAPTRAAAKMSLRARACRVELWACGARGEGACREVREVREARVVSGGLLLSCSTCASRPKAE